jgi:ankyrin repeat protein
MKKKVFLITMRRLSAILISVILWAGIAQAEANLDEQLVRAAKAGDAALVDTLLTKGAFINAKDLCGQTALMWAAKEGHAEVVQLLLSKNADVHTRDEGGRTALMWAGREVYAKVLQLLLENGADVNEKDRYGETALTLAIQFLGYDGITQMEECCPLDREERNCSSDGMRPPWRRESERTEVMKLLQPRGADEALIVAASQRDEKKIRQLLDAGADVRARTTNGVTALMMAIEWRAVDKRGNADVAKLLLEKGADANSPDNYGRTALTRAVLLGQADMVKLLLDKGADINAVDKYGWTPLMFAASQGQPDVLRYLLDKGAYINVQAMTGRTALMAAAQSIDYYGVKQLLDRGADINARTKDGQTALMLAVEIGLTRSGLAAQVVRLLLERGADANARDRSGTTVLRKVPKIKGSDEIVKLLKAYGVKE